ncbi:MAG: polysaccharide deacetylase family protein [Rhodanobacteraceae bacterium]
MKRQRLAAFIGKVGMRGILAKCLPAKGIVGLNYHRIGDGSRSNLDRGLWSATRESFDQQLAYLKRNCDVIAPADIDEARKDARSLHVLVTFDDGYRDNYEVAFPALQRHGIPATFFIATGFIDQPRLPWWDEIAAIVRFSPRDTLELDGWLSEPLPIRLGERQQTIETLLALYKSLPTARAKSFIHDLRASAAAPTTQPAAERLWMTWDMIRDLAAHGMTIGGHTVNHVVLANASREEQRREISACTQRIEHEVGLPVRYLAYPVGGRDTFNADTLECLRQAGIRYAFSYYGGYATAESHPYDMPRMAMEPYIDREWFRAIVSVPRLFCPMYC